MPLSTVLPLHPPPQRQRISSICCLSCGLRQRLLLRLCPSIRGEEPRDGLMRLKVDIVTLPPLAEAEQTAMLDLRSIETGGQGHFPPFLGYHTGFPDENLFTVNRSAHVFMATDLVEPFFHPDEHPCTCVPPRRPQTIPGRASQFKIQTQHADARVLGRNAGGAGGMQEWPQGAACEVMLTAPCPMRRSPR